MRILVTGAGGFVGTAILKRLSAHDLVLPSRRRQNIAGPAGQIAPEFTEDLEALVAGHRPEIIINLLGILNESGGETFEKVHFEYTRRLVDGAGKYGVRRFIQMSALGASAASPSRYLSSKARAEEYLQNSGLDHVIFRPSLIIGPGQKMFSDLRKLAAYSPFFPVPSDALATPVGLEDVADCFASAALGGLGEGIYELVGTEEMSFKDIFRLALEYCGINRPVLGLPRIFFYPLLPLFSLFPQPPMTREQYLMLAGPNSPSGRYPGVKEILGGIRDAFGPGRGG